MAKQKLPTLTTPRGTFGYTWINKPDSKFAKEGEKGDYKTELTVDSGPCAELIAKIDEAADEKMAAVEKDLKSKGNDPKAKKALQKLSRYVPYDVLTDDDGDEIGRVKFRFKVNAEGKNDKGETWDNKPPLFDAKGKPADLIVRGGSEGKVSFQIVPFYNAATGDAGVTLRLKAVQAIKLAAGGGGSASSYGFGAEDGGDDEHEGDAADRFTDESGSDDEGDVDF